MVYDGDDGMVDMGAVLYGVQDHVATVMLNRPERLNALGHAPGGVYRSLMDALETADRDPDVRCIVLRGAGRAFSAGGDLQSTPKVTAKDWYWFLVEGDLDNERIRALDTPVIGAIHGYCYGAALMLALHLDILIASEDARFGLMETRFGQPGADVLVYHVGPQWAKFLAISGEILTAAKAREIGLVMEVFAADTFLAKVYDLARRVAAMPPDGVVFNRRVVNSAMDMAGWRNQKTVSNALSAVLNSVAREQATLAGEKFSELRTRDWEAFKEARDKPFAPPWLEG